MQSQSAACLLSELAAQFYGVLRIFFSSGVSGITSLDRVTDQECECRLERSPEQLCGSYEIQ
jgi:hypothetical protein